MLTRLRWSAFGLRGRIVGAVLGTAAVTLVVAGLVLLPQLEHALRQASKTTLQNQVFNARRGNTLARLAKVDYGVIGVPALTDPRADKQVREYAISEAQKLADDLSTLKTQFGATDIAMFGLLNEQGKGVQIPVNSTAASASAGGCPFAQTSVTEAFLDRADKYTFRNCGGSQVIEAAIWLGPSSDAVLAVSASLGEIPAAEKTVRRAFLYAAGAAILMTLLIAIPLAGTLVGRLRRLRQAALQIAIDGSNRAHFPVDRARDEVGDLARSFSIMQRRLRQQEEARRAFVATASHELRTPLASLDGMLELLADDLGAEPVDVKDAAALLERARAQSRRLGRLAADLLDLSRIDAEVTLRSEPVELGELGRAVLAEFELAIAERGVVTVLKNGKPVWALADPGSVARILRILLDNALRVAPRGSEVKVQIAAEPVPTLSVIDGGPGVAPEERALIFDRFKRGRETGGEAGFGLGLAIGRELAQRMGGSLVLTDTEGAGASFALTLRPTQAPDPDQVTGAAWA